MRLVIQRVTKAEVEINNRERRQIDKGLLVFLGIHCDDDEEDLNWLVKKLINLRIFSDSEGRMNLSVLDISGEVLIISQFTLYASTKKGNRPSFINAEKPEKAIPLYESFITTVSRNVRTVKSGTFGADMKISLLNDGPVTIIIDSKIRE